MIPAPRKPRGFGLPECLTVVFLALLLLLLGVPTFRELAQDVRLSSAVNSLVHGIHVARHEAAHRHVPVVLCRSGDGRRCTPEAGPASGWLVFVNRDGDQPPQVDPGETILQVMPGFPGGRISANRPAFIFRPYGRRSVNGTLVLCDVRGEAAARLVIVSYSGRPRSILARDHEEKFTCPM
jgi:type IV fimbrial biogenesis protein FimT